MEQANNNAEPAQGLPEQQMLQMVNSYVVSTASALNTLAMQTQSELDSIMDKVNRLQEQVEMLERTVQQPPAKQDDQPAAAAAGGGGNGGTNGRPS